MSDKNPFDELYAVDIMILGIGCILYGDEGFGVRVVEKLQQLYEFPDNVLAVDGDPQNTCLWPLIGHLR